MIRRRGRVVFLVVIGVVFIVVVVEELKVVIGRFGSVILYG